MNERSRHDSIRKCFFYTLNSNAIRSPLEWPPPGYRYLWKLLYYVSKYLMYVCMGNQIEGSRPDGSKLGRGLAEASPP